MHIYPAQALTNASDSAPSCPALPCPVLPRHSFIHSLRQTDSQAADPENSIQNFIKATSYGHIKQMAAICIGRKGEWEGVRRELPHQKVV